MLWQLLENSEAGELDKSTLAVYERDLSGARIIPMSRRWTSLRNRWGKMRNLTLMSKYSEHTNRLNAVFTEEWKINCFPMLKKSLTKNLLSIKYSQKGGCKTKNNNNIAIPSAEVISINSHNNFSIHWFCVNKGDHFSDLPFFCADIAIFFFFFCKVIYV